MKIFLLVFSLFIALVLVLLVGFGMIRRENDSNLIIPKSLPITPNTSRLNPLKIKVSIPYWDQENAITSFKKNVDLINYVSLFWYFLGSDGDIHKYKYAKEDLSIINFAHDKEIKVEVVITNLPENGGWDSERVKKILKNTSLRQKHIEEIVELVQRLGIDGIDIDYEQLDKDFADDFSRFIQDLGIALRKRGKYLGVALHPKSDDGIGNTNGALAQDWKELGKGADNLYIMAFGEHWDEGGPGPIASLTWVESIVKYAQSLGIDKSKLFLAIPLYGYEWRKESDKAALGLTFQDAQKIVSGSGVEVKWDEGVASSYFVYKKGGNEFEVWFEDARSVEQKIKLADSAGFAGITFWRLGGEDPQIWEDLSSRP